MGGFSTEGPIFLLFLCSVVAVYVLCFGILENRRKRKLKAYELGMLCVGAVGIACFIYGFIEPFQLDTTYATINSNKIKSSAVRIVHISDLHCDGIIRTEKRLPALIQSLHPDLIVFTGDSANNKNGLIDFRNCISALSKIAPLYGVYGNHDMSSGFNPFDNTGVKKLYCSADKIDVKGSEIWIAGAPAAYDCFAANLLAQAPADAFSIYLYHYPVGLNNAVAHNIDLVCAGHTHGGQIRLPFYGALVTNSALGKKFEYGLGRVGKTYLNVSPGIGMTGLPIRFLAPPEVSVIDIKPIQ